MYDLYLANKVTPILPPEGLGVVLASAGPSLCASSQHIYRSFCLLQQRVSSSIHLSIKKIEGELHIWLLGRQRDVIGQGA